MTILKSVVVLGILVSSVSFAGTRQDAIEAAIELQEAASEMARIARRYNYPRTYDALKRIEELAQDAEDAARYDSRRDTSRVVSRIIRTYRVNRQFMSNIPEVENRSRIIRKTRTAINLLSLEVNGPQAQIVRRAPGGAAPSQEQIDQEEEQELQRAENAAPRGEWEAGDAPQERRPDRRPDRGEGDDDGFDPEDREDRDDRGFGNPSTIDDQP